MAKLPHALPDKSWNPAELPLNPCKFCCAVESNDPRHLLEDDSPSLSANHASFLPRIFVECGGCGSRGPYGPSTWAAVDRWNILHNVPLSEFPDGMFYDDPCKPTKDPAIGGCGVTTELKPCPFPHCGDTGPTIERGDWHFVRCSNDDCGCFGPDGDTPEQAAERWNAAPRRDDVPVAVAVEETLHDRYVMAALTGWMANPASGDCTVKACVDDAFAAADAAMKARKT